MNQPEECCPNCQGTGCWETECCDGSRGCSCRGEIIQMGTCNACRGAGVIDSNYDGSANFRAIEGLCYIGSGPR